VLQSEQGIKECKKLIQSIPPEGGGGNFIMALGKMEKQPVCALLSVTSSSFSDTSGARGLKIGIHNSYTND